MLYEKSTPLVYTSLIAFVKLYGCIVQCDYICIQLLIHPKQPFTCLTMKKIGHSILSSNRQQVICTLSLACLSSIFYSCFVFHYINNQSQQKSVEVEKRTTSFPPYHQWILRKDIHTIAPTLYSPLPSLYYESVQRRPW